MMMIEAHYFAVLWSMRCVCVFFLLKEIVDGFSGKKMN